MSASTINDLMKALYPIDLIELRAAGIYVGMNDHPITRSQWERERHRNRWYRRLGRWFDYRVRHRLALFIAPWLDR